MKSKITGGMYRVMELLPTKLVILSSVRSTANKKEKRKEEKKVEKETRGNEQCKNSGSL
jgi:hypothetical protein